MLVGVTILLNLQAAKNQVGIFLEVEKPYRAYEHGSPPMGVPLICSAHAYYYAN